MTGTMQDTQRKGNRREVIQSMRKRARLEYKTVVVRDLKSLRYAELLRRHGWQTGSVGFETILFYRKCEA